MGLDDGVDLLIEERSLTIASIFAIVELTSNISDGIIGLLSKIVDCDPGSQDAIVRMDNILNKRDRTI